MTINASPRPSKLYIDGRYYPGFLSLQGGDSDLTPGGLITYQGNLEILDHPDNPENLGDTRSQLWGHGSRVNLYLLNPDGVYRHHPRGSLYITGGDYDPVSSRLTLNLSCALGFYQGVSLDNLFLPYEISELLAKPRTVNRQSYLRAILQRLGLKLSGMVEGALKFPFATSGDAVAVCGEIVASSRYPAYLYSRSGVVFIQDILMYPSRLTVTVGRDEYSYRPVSRSAIIPKVTYTGVMLSPATDDIRGNNGGGNESTNEVSILVPPKTPPSGSKPLQPGGNYSYEFSVTGGLEPMTAQGRYGEERAVNHSEGKTTTITTVTLTERGCSASFNPTSGALDDDVPLNVITITETQSPTGRRRVETKQSRKGMVLPTAVDKDTMIPAYESEETVETDSEGRVTLETKKVKECAGKVYASGYAIAQDDAGLLKTEMVSSEEIYTTYLYNRNTKTVATKATVTLRPVIGNLRLNGKPLDTSVPPGDGEDQTIDAWYGKTFVAEKTVERWWKAGGCDWHQTTVHRSLRLKSPDTVDFMSDDWEVKPVKVAIQAALVSVSDKVDSSRTNKANAPINEVQPSVLKSNYPSGDEPLDYLNPGNLDENEGDGGGRGNRDSQGNPKTFTITSIQPTNSNEIYGVEFYKSSQYPDRAELGRQDDFGGKYFTTGFDPGTFPGIPAIEPGFNQEPPDLITPVGYTLPTIITYDPELQKESNRANNSDPSGGNWEEKNIRVTLESRVPWANTDRLRRDTLDLGRVESYGHLSSLAGIWHPVILGRTKGYELVLPLDYVSGNLPPTFGLNVVEPDGTRKAFLAYGASHRSDLETDLILFDLAYLGTTPGVKPITTVAGANLTVQNHGLTTGQTVLITIANPDYSDLGNLSNSQVVQVTVVDENTISIPGYTFGNQTLPDGFLITPELPPEYFWYLPKVTVGGLRVSGLLYTYEETNQDDLLILGGITVGGRVNDYVTVRSANGITTGGTTSSRTIDNWLSGVTIGGIQVSRYTQENQGGVTIGGKVTTAINSVNGVIISGFTYLEDTRLTRNNGVKISGFTVRNPEFYHGGVTVGGYMSRNPVETFGGILVSGRVYNQDIILITYGGITTGGNLETSELTPWSVIDLTTWINLTESQWSLIKP